MVRPAQPGRRPGAREFLDPRRQQRLAAGILLALVLAWRLWTALHEGAQPGAGTAGTVPRATPPGSTGTRPPAAAETGQDRVAADVRRVVDGDTLLLRDGTRVRLIGVDTPETKRENYPVEPWGPEASEFTRKWIGQGDVVLEFDGERYDNYGRLLAHVYVGDVCLNVELLRQGLARALYRHPYSNAMKDRFRAAENEAKRAHRGIWSGEVSPGSKSTSF